jgi:acyl-CoA thioesterase-1
MRPDRQADTPEKMRIYDEPLFFIDRGADTAASLWCPAERLVAVRHGFSGVDYEEGRDFTVDLSAGRVHRLAGSRMPATPIEELVSSVDRDGSGFMFARDSPGSFLMVAEDDTFHRRQVHATYDVREGLWSGPVASFRGDQLPRTLRRLLAGDPLALVVTGDSISEGYNASGFLGVPPHQPPYVNLVADGLRRAYGASIALHNLAVAGSSSDSSLADVERLVALRPDLVIVAFGMNDAGYATAADFAANVAGIIDAVRRGAPDAEFVLVSPMLPNPQWHYPVIERFDEYRAALASLCGDGIVVADVTTVWRHVLQRKSFYDLTGNGINHPNDFGHRLYADAILASLVDSRS